MADSPNAAFGRPREFDLDEALERAMQVFCARVRRRQPVRSDRAMGITKSSMYAAYGNKEQLFRKALQRYAEGPASYATEP